MATDIKASEITYILKNGSLYDINSRLGVPLSIEDVTRYGERFQLLIDDSYFFYVSIGKLSVSRKKLSNVIANYLQSMFPMELFAGYALENNKGQYTALIYKDEFASLLKEHEKFFHMARKISTAFCELSTRYQVFLFTDGSRVYSRDNDKIEFASETLPGTLRADDVYGDIVPFKTEISIKGIRAVDMNRGYKLAAIFLAACYIIFLASGIIDVMSVKKLETQYQQILSDLYTTAGVSSSADPYMTLRTEAERKQLAPFKALDVLYALGQAVPENVTIDSFSLNERLVRIEGFTDDFAQMERLVANMESRLQKQITLEDSRQAGEQIKFVIRYEP